MPSLYRPTLVDVDDAQVRCVSGGTAYLMILNAVRGQHGLIHGKLHCAGEHCAIGSYFAINPRGSLPYAVIDEVAAVNDSAPGLTKRQRKQMVLRWLRWKLQTLGMLTVGRQARLADVGRSR